MKGFFSVLEFMLVLQYFNVQKVRNLRAEHFESYSSFKHRTQTSVYRVFCPSDWVIDCNILILFRPSTAGTIPLTTHIFAYSYKMVCISPNNKQKYAKLSIPFKLCDAIKT